MKHLIPFLFCLGAMQGAFAQEVLENNPPSLKWYQIKSPHFKIIYPAGFEQQAQRVTNTLEHIYEPEAKSLGVRPRKISVVLQNQSSISNGFVTMIPRRSEFFTMPTQDYNFGGTNDWLDQLATHEYRHIVQYQRSITGFNKALYYVFGPATLTAMSITAVPQWFWEGDAVATETAFTHSGRGRIPNFGLLMRTNLQEGRVFNYHKQYLRSYKHNIPDHYVLGYYMVGYLRKRTNDPDIWEKITRRAWNVPFIPFTFSNAIKKETGLYVTQLYREMAADLNKSFTEELNNIQFTSFEKVSSRKAKAYTNYANPQVLPDGSIVAMKSGIADISQLVTLKDGIEELAFTPGITNDAGMLSAAGSTVVWNEFGFDARWRVKNYSLIKAYDVSTNRHWIITSKSRYSGAALSPDAKKVVTVESATDYAVALVVITSDYGNVLKKFANPDNAFYSMARWSSDGKKIVSLKTKDYQRSIVAIDYESGKEETLVEPSRENRGHPVLHGNYLFYNSPVTGIDNIYVFDIEKQQHLQVTSSKYASYNPVISADGKTIYYNEQTKDGLDVVSIPLDPAAWKSFSPASVKQYDHYLTEQEGRPTLFDSIPSTQYATKKYTSQLKPYSWGAYLNTTFTQADIGISSRDILSKVDIKAGYLYDINERTGSTGVTFSYQGWYPIIDLSFRYGKRSVDIGASEFLGIDTVATQPVLELDTFLIQRNLKFTWDEKKTEAGIRIPLLTTKSKYHGSVNFSNYLGLVQVSGFQNGINNERLIPYVFRDGPNSSLTPSPQDGYFYYFRDYVDNGNLIYNRFGISAFRLLKQSTRDINSKWGQAFYLNWYATPYGGDFSGNQFSFYTVLYFPGFFKHHSIWGYWSFQSTKVPTLSEGADNYIFDNQIPLPRGLGISRFQKFYSMSGNYTLPLLYPDIAIGPLLNIQRFRGNAFLDYGFGTSQFGNQVVSQVYTSVGGELKMDFNFMRFLPQFNIGVRYSYGLKPVGTQIDILIGLVGL
jgi:hypothetical protein